MQNQLPRQWLEQVERFSIHQAISVGFSNHNDGAFPV